MCSILEGDRGGPPPIANGFFLKTNGKQISGKGGLPPSIADEKTNVKKLTDRGGTPPSLRTIPVTRVFEAFPYPHSTS